MNNYSLFANDLEVISSKLSSFINDLQGKVFFLTGASGFVGIWLVESLLYISEKFALNLNIFLLTRSKVSFYKKYPHLHMSTGLYVIEGDILSFSNKFQNINYIIHGANLPYDNTSSWALKHIDFAMAGTRKVLDLARKYDVTSILLTSSGAIYRDFLNNARPPYQEDSFELTLKEAQIYSHTKQSMELYCKAFAQATEMPISIARLFTFSGSYIPLDKGFALGNFMQSALKGYDIVVESLGNSIRSYMYGTDMAIWLLTSLFVGKTQVYNVGSNIGVSIKELAYIIGKLYGGKVQILGKEDNGYASQIYLPDISSALSLGLTLDVDFEQGINKMFAWYRGERK